MVFRMWQGGGGKRGRGDGGEARLNYFFSGYNSLARLYTNSIAI